MNGLDHEQPLPPVPGPRPGLFGRFAEQYEAVTGSLTPLGAVDALLKRPGEVAHALLQKGGGRVRLAIAALAIACLAGYGFLMGTFPGGHQLWVVPVKLCLACLGSALLCLPSLYIFSCLSGGRLSLGHVASLLLQGLALAALLLAGFAPIAWIFSQSTDTAAFMGALHLAFAIVGIHFALKLLGAAMDYLTPDTRPLLRAWGWIFLIVVFQMTTFFRPLVGPFQGYRLQGRQFFAAHWIDTLQHGR